MVKEISNIVDSVLPVISIASLTASAFMGRKFGLAIGYDFSSRIASLFGKQNVAEEYSKASSDYWTLAKKNAFRDLTAAAGFFTLGVASIYAGKALAKEEPKEESGWCDNVPVLSTLLNYKKTVLVVTTLGFHLLIFSDWYENKTKKVNDFCIQNIINDIKNGTNLFSLNFYDSMIAKQIKCGYGSAATKQYLDFRANMK